MCRFYVRIGWATNFELGETLFTSNGILWQNNRRAITPGSNFWNWMPDYDVKGIGMAMLLGRGRRFCSLHFRDLSAAVRFGIEHGTQRVRALVVHKRLFDRRVAKAYDPSEVQPIYSPRDGLIFAHAGTVFYRSEGNRSPDGGHTDSQFLFDQLLKRLHNRSKTPQTVLDALIDLTWAVSDQVCRPSILILAVVSAEFAIVTRFGVGKEPPPVFFRGSVATGYEIAMEVPDGRPETWITVPSATALIVTPGSEPRIHPLPHASMMASVRRWFRTCPV